MVFSTFTACPLAADGRPQFRCPLTRHQDICIDDYQMCNGRKDCLKNEDEDPVMCMFYRVVSSTAFSNSGSYGKVKYP